ncbi:MAG: NAD(P)H-binding protein [Burkholderiales bacterium]|nr:NAD(P)H-binding protein [Burkholderiales bacterium]
MTLSFERIAVLGATGPTGRALTAELMARGFAVRVVSRSADALRAHFPEPAIEKRPGSALQLDALAPALEGCDLVVDCIGLPAERMAQHPVTARNLARFVREAGARCLQVSSYWSYLPIRELPVSERHPRAGGPPWARIRRETEDILREAGGAIVHLPDFFGPQVHSSTLQRALTEALEGGTMNWIGPAEVERDYVYVPDAMRVVAELATREAAYGEDWIVPGSGPISASRLAAILGKLLDREVRVRAAPPWLLGAMALFNPELRAFLPMVPEYVKPIAFDGAKLAALIGDTPRTAYEDALRELFTGV